MRRWRAHIEPDESGALSVEGRLGGVVLRQPVDTMVDKELENGSPEASARTGKIAIANPRRLPPLTEIFRGEGSASLRSVARA